MPVRKRKMSGRKAKKAKAPYKLDLKRGRITVYGKQWCPYCREAKEIISTQGKGSKYIEISDKMLRSLARKTKDAKTIPLTFEGKRYVGGLAELKTLLKPMPSFERPQMDLEVDEEHMPVWVLTTKTKDVNQALRNAWKTMSAHV